MKVVDGLPTLEIINGPFFCSFTAECVAYCRQISVSLHHAVAEEEESLYIYIFNSIVEAHLMQIYFYHSYK